MIKLTKLFTFSFFLIIFVSCAETNSDKQSHSIEAKELVTYTLGDSLRFSLYPFVQDNQTYIVLPSFLSQDTLLSNKCNETDSLLIYLQSTVPSVFITTASGNMKSVDGSVDKSVKEKGLISIVNVDGSLEYQGCLSHIKGRGHNSWTQEKKPYNIKLENKTSIFGFRRSKNYCLLANASDGCSLRNYCTYKFARHFGMPYSIDIQPIALWLNGHYQGLYMLTERIGAGKAGANLKVQPEEKDGGILFEGIQDGDDPQMCLHTLNGDKFALKDPEIVDSIQLRSTEQRYRDMELALTSQGGINPVTGKHFSEYIDITSFVKYYLLQEIFANNDAFWGSYYFYKNADEIDSLFYAGPLWDMDKSLFLKGQRVSSCPEALYAFASNSSLFQYLCNNLQFQDSIKSIYCREASSLLRVYFDTKIDSLYHIIQNDVAIENLRWPKKSASEQDFADIKHFMHQRISFLDNLCTSDHDLIKVIVHRSPQELYMHPAVCFIEKGDTIKLNQFNTTFSGFNYVGCFDREGKSFVSSTPIQEDMELFMRWEYASFEKRFTSKMDEFRVRFGAFRQKLLN